MAQRYIADITIGGDIYLNGKRREVHKHAPKVGVPNESTTSLFVVHAKAVQRILKVWDVEDFTDENLLPIQGDNDGSAAEDRVV